TGLGLAIVKEFVDLHAGVITVSESAIGGARFEIKMTRRQGDRDDAALTTNNVQEDSILQYLRDAGDDADYGKARPRQTLINNSSTLPKVLIVEDNVEMNRFICEALRTHYQVYTSFNGSEGFALAERVLPDL